MNIQNWSICGRRSSPTSVRSSHNNMTNPLRPLSESYWVEPGRLLAGEYPGKYDPELTRKRIDALLEAGFDTFIDLTKDGETTPYLSLLKEQSAAYDLKAKHYRFPIG